VGATVPAASPPAAAKQERKAALTVPTHSTENTAAKTPPSEEAEEIPPLGDQKSREPGKVDLNAVAEPFPTDETKRDSAIEHLPLSPQTAKLKQTPKVQNVGAGVSEKIVPMSQIRRRIGERLVQAQQSAALLTTFNEVDMTAVREIRAKYRDLFLAKHQTKLGFMSFFIKAAIAALQAVPEVNAEIRGRDIVYHNNFDIGIAVGSGKGLVVPVLRGAEHLTFAEIENAIANFVQRAEANKLVPDELHGGTFTISNGGVYGSLLSTPIVNPPQSAVLGLHAIQDRPVARQGAVLVRPMMYVALTYDHRIIDGREAVGFLKRIKELIEEPLQMLLGL
jgi:2-oxoglutarate dehydrogenase E2 component (dihydrolipoamide succinyltransferase)